MPPTGHACDSSPLISILFPTFLCTFPSLLQVACECLGGKLEKLKLFWQWHGESGLSQWCWRVCQCSDAFQGFCSHVTSESFHFICIRCCLVMLTMLVIRAPWHHMIFYFVRSAQQRWLHCSQSLARARWHTHTLAHTHARTRRHAHAHARVHTRTRTTIDTQWTVAHSILQVWVVNVFSINGDPEVRRLTRDFAAY